MSNDMKMLPSFITIGDPHIRKDALPRSEVAIEKLLAHIDTLNLDFIVVMGDTLDRFGTVSTCTLTLATHMLKELKARAHVYLLIGNHDYPNNSVYLSKEHPFIALHEWDGLTVVDEIVKRDINGMKAFFAPYVKTGRLIEALDASDKIEGSPWDWRSADIGFGHQEIRGCKMGGIISTEGDVWDPKFPFIIMGHCHDRHSPQPNVRYCGSMIQQSAGDSKKKTVSTWKTFKLEEKDDGRRFRYVEERHDLGVASHAVHHVDFDQLKSWEPPCLDTREVQGAMKIVIHGTKNELVTFRKTGIAKKWKDMGYKITMKDKKEDEIDDILILDDEKQNFRKLLEKSIEPYPRLKSLVAEVVSEI